MGSMVAGLWRLVRDQGPTLPARTLVINHLTLAPPQVAAFDQLTEPRVLESGHYWFDTDTGDLGWVGSPTPYLNLYLPHGTTAAELPPARRALLERAGCIAA